MEWRTKEGQSAENEVHNYNNNKVKYKCKGQYIDDLDN